MYKQGRLCNMMLSVAAVMFALSCGNNSTSKKSEAGHEHSETHVHGNEHSEHDHAGHDHEVEAHAKGLIAFSAAQAESAGLKTEIVELGKFSGVIRTSGEILPAQGDETTVSATTSGIISFGNGLTPKAGHTRMLPGAKVLNGSTLLWISAKNIADGDPAVKAKAVYETAEKEYNRASELVKTGAISRKSLEQAELAYKTALAEYEAYRGRSSESGVAVKSPMPGYIKQILVNEGDYVEAGQALAVVTQNRRLQLQADVPEKYFNRISAVTMANFRPSYSDKTFSLKDLGGRLVSSGRASARGSFYVPVIFEFSNTDNFIPGAYSDVYLIESERDNVISVPESALTEEQGVYFVYLKVGVEDYKKQEVKIGQTDGIRREILSGLNAGDEVVAEGAFQVKLASVSGIVPEGHSHNH